MEYVFGDNEIAARRLELLAEVFAEPTRPFLRQAAPTGPRLALDLGCGPGCTTHLLADLVGGEHTAGLDNSERFVSLARRTAAPNVSFHLHDVTVAPFPVGPADVIYSRFLLTHLPDPAAAVATWGTQLGPGGRLLIEEVEWIRTNNAVFSGYLETVDAMLASQSNCLYVGPDLDRFEDSDVLRKRASAVRPFGVANGPAAALFAMNARTWKHHPFVRENRSPEWIARLERDLRALSEDPDGRPTIEWGLRQVVFERR